MVVNLVKIKLPKIRAPPEWGIEPVDAEHRYLGSVDYFVLWTSLGKGLLVFWAGALLVPYLDLTTALIAIIAGSIIGSLPLAIAGIIGSDNAIPTMAALRPSFGIRGSYLPSLLNIIQLIGWGAFEIWVMATAVDVVTEAILNYSNFYLWVMIFALLCVAMGISGPLMVIRQWLEKFVVWILYGSTIWIAYWALTTHSFWELVAMPAQGGLSFSLAIDYTIAMPISWMPLIADYNRFARTSKGGFWGTYIGYVVANIVGYGVGAILILAFKPLGVTDVVSAIMLVYLGGIVILSLLTYEIDNGWADIYSSAVSIQNLLPKLSQRKLIVLIGAVSAILAMFIPIAEYEWFLLWIGSVFCPLFGVIFVDYFLIKRRKYDVSEIYKTKGAYWFWKGINFRAVIAWATGVLIYYFIVYLIPWLGASVPSLAATACLYWILTKIK